MAMPDKVCGVRYLDVSQSRVYACDFPLELAHSLICTFVNVYCSSMQKMTYYSSMKWLIPTEMLQVWGRVQEVHGGVIVVGLRRHAGKT